jgi:hypothetical protein
VLRQIEEKAGETPVREYVAAVISKHPNFDDAATELGISIPSLRRVRRHFGIQVAS